MYAPNPKTVLRATRIQERVLRKLDLNPENVKIAVRKHNQTKTAGIHPPSSDEMAEVLGLRFNEVEQDKSADFRLYLSNPCITVYDKLPFLRRLCNIVALCHAHYAAPEMARYVHVSTLPIAPLNGVCTSEGQSETLIFFNEGILHFAPKLLRALNPIPADHRIWSKLVEGQFSIELESFITTQTTHITNFLERLLYFLSDELKAAELYPERDMFLPHAFETWRIEQILRTNVAEHRNYSEDMTRKFIDKAKWKEVLYYRARGFFIFLVAHEMSHYYREHLIQRESGAYMVDDAAVDAVFQYARDSLPASYPTPKLIEQLRSPEFRLYQRQEEVADIDAFQILWKYVVDNQLDDYQIDALAYGMNFFFALSELVVRIYNAKASGVETVNRIAGVDPFLRCAINNTEHPSPLWRMLNVLEVADHIPRHFRDHFERNYQTVSAMMNIVWGAIATNSELIFSQLKLGQMIELDTQSIFAGMPAMGHLGSEHFEDSIFNQPGWSLAGPAGS